MCYNVIAIYVQRRNGNIAVHGWKERTLILYDKKKNKNFDLC